MALSGAARSVWAKSLNADGAWLPLWQHMDDSAAIAGGLFDQWLPPHVVGLLANPFDGDRAAARTALTFLAGLHDLGKATPAFAVQDGVLADRMRRHGLDLPSQAELIDRRKVHHSVAGHHLLIRWLHDRGWLRQGIASWAVVIGGHHGVPPASESVQNTAPIEYPKLYGEGPWTVVQRELADRMASRTGATAYLDCWREVKLPATFQVITTGLVILADWISSNESLLPYSSEELPDEIDDPDRAARALHRLALPAPWRPDHVPDSVEQLFKARFHLPAGAKSRPVQAAAFDTAWTMPAPGLVIIEAPMGEGKTEAALAAAEIMSQRWGSGGVHIALPTQATSDAMFDRVVAWLDAMGSHDKTIGVITLSHGKARFNRLFQGIIDAGRVAQVGCDEDPESGVCHLAHTVVAHSWLSGRKKSQLATFVVGTIDQLLFAGLKARHLMLRHVALAAKVVVIDEVHAYDAFMNSYLTKVLTWLGAYRVPVVALSATLPWERRHALLDAYQRGRLGAENLSTADASGHHARAPIYPLISWTEGTEVKNCGVAPSGRRTTVLINALGGNAEDDQEALSTLLRELLSDGGCALVVRNTVRRVLDTAAALQQWFGVDVSVAHSRFIVADRLRNDAELLHRFGPQGDRPARHIVVASQVVEQSLDVDFDLLITDLAPTDLVLQRMGRLHRHARGTGQAERPPKLQAARTYIAGADFACNPPQLETAAAHLIYDVYPMLRAAAVLLPRFGGTVELPDDIAALVQSAYGPEHIEPSSWRGAVDAAHQKWRERIDRRTSHATYYQIGAPQPTGKAILGWISGSVGETDDEAQGQGQVRDGPPALEAIVVQQSGSGDWFTPGWLPNGQASVAVPQDRVPSANLAAILAACSVRLPVGLSTPEVEETLWTQTPSAWEQSALVYPLPIVIIDSAGRGQVGGHAIRYTRKLGLEVLDA
jgi:CRISPR-associated endonuclease/helicase Cas3